MLFIEFRFLLFFIVIFSVYWALRWNNIRKIWLLLASYFFYAAWDWRFLSLILISTIVDYAVGFTLPKAKTTLQRRVLLFSSLCVNFGLLGFFKYFNFFYDSAVGFFQFLGLNFNPSTMKIILPVGISFYTFQTLSYTIDIFRRKLKPYQSLLDVALFVAFFPQLVAGPIVRASVYLPQLKLKKLFSNVKVRSFLMLFLIGFIKKACIADNMAPFVDQYFSDPASFGGLSAIIAVIAYAVQIYCDFSGYSDIAIACAGLLGFYFPINFNFPYFAKSITEFWRRWHISLSTWLRDYLYISLGGSRGSRIFTYRNLMLTMLLGGLWHGAGWTFVIWGAMHGIALIVNKLWTEIIRLDRSKAKKTIPQVFSILLTFYWVCIAWIFFRAESLPRAWDILKDFLFLRGNGETTLPLQLLILFIIFGLSHWIAYTLQGRSWPEKIDPWLFSIGYGVVFAVAFSFFPISYQPFIYFQF